MKFLFVGVASAVLLQRGISKSSLMQNQGAHWRKNWPEGAIDNGDDDSDVMNIGGNGRTMVKRDPPKKYVAKEWSLDEDVVHTKSSLNLAEQATGAEMTPETVHDRGMTVLYNEFFDPVRDVMATRRNPDGTLSKATADNNVSA